MQRYAILDSTNNVMSVTVWDGNSVWQTPVGTSALMIPENSPVNVGWRYIPTSNSFLRPGPTDPSMSIRRMEKIDFMRLFTTMEMVRYKMLRMAIDNLTQADYTAAMQGDQQKMMLVQADVMFDRFDLASSLEMDHAETIMGVQMMAMAGIFGNVASGEVTQEYVDQRVERILAGLGSEEIPA